MVFLEAQTKKKKIRFILLSKTSFSPLVLYEFMSSRRLANQSAR